MRKTKGSALVSSRLWLEFHFFLAVNLFLSYSPLSPGIKWGIGLPALAAALWYSLRMIPTFRAGGNPSFSHDWLPSFPWAMASLTILAGVARFAGLTTFFTYPLYDDVLNAFFAYHLNQHWTWHPFFYYSQMPPLYIWMLAGSFKAAGVSAPVLWLLPALVSLLCVPLSYAACRTLFSRSFALACAFLVALSFWPLWLGRISHQMGLMVLLEWLSLWLFGKFLKAPSTVSMRKWAVGLGLGIGVGFYTYFAWPVVALFVSVVVLVRAFQQAHRSAVVWYSFSVILALSPLLAAALPGHFGFYVTHRWLSKADTEWDFLHSLYYPTTLFWEGWKGYFGYAPRWGGFLNPILGAFFALGAVEAWRFRRHAVAKAFATAFFLFLLPVLMTDNYSASRLTPLLPLCLIGTCWGLQRLGLSLGGGKEKIYLVFLLALSLLLDARNLAETRAYTNACKVGPKYTRSFKAWDLISPLREEGNGAAFLDFVNDNRDRSLSFLTFPFNTVVNPQIPADSISWAAVLADEDYKPCLTRRFPGIQWHWLDWDMRDMKGGIYFVRGIYLGVIPLSPGNRQTILRWVKAGRDLEEIALADLNYVPPHPHEAVLREMGGFYGDFGTEDFLRTFYWEKVADDEMQDHGDGPALTAMENALRTQCPRGYLYHQWGQLLVRTKQYKKAAYAFREAGRLDPRFNPPASVLQWLGRLGKKSPGS